VAGSTQYGCSPAWSTPCTSAQPKRAQTSTGWARLWIGAPAGSAAVTLNERTTPPLPTWKPAPSPNTRTATLPVGEATKPAGNRIVRSPLGVWSRFS
jgi:hypothetical protein